MDKILDKELNHFKSWFITTAGMQGDAAQGQLMYRSMYARYHGVSRSAMNVFAKDGMFLPLTTFDRRKAVIEEEQKLQVRSVFLWAPLILMTLRFLHSFSFSLAERRPHTVWLDNFSKIYSKKMPNLASGAYDLCHWTGRAIRVSKEYFDTSLMQDAQGRNIPAMPDDLFGEENALLARVDGLMAQPVGPGAHPMHKYATSAVILWQVNNVPPRPHRDLAPMKYFQVLTEHVDTVKGQCFIPTGVLKQNINTNEDLCRIIRSHYEDNNMHIHGALACTNYHALSTDMAIFHRVLKVHSHSAPRYSH